MNKSIPYILGFFGGLLVSGIVYYTVLREVAEVNPEKQKELTQTVVDECVYSSRILPPPDFHSSIKPKVNTNREGEAFLQWTEVKGAKAYRVVLEDQNGQRIKTYKTSRTVIYLNDFPKNKEDIEANYTLRLLSVNGLDQDGDVSATTRELVVRPQAKIFAPEVKEIRVEE